MKLRRHIFVSPRLVSLLLSTVSIFWAWYVFAYGNGRTGDSTASTGCSCHDSTPNAHGVMSVSITGPQVVQVGSISDYTISVTGDPAGTTGGFGLTSSGGTFTAGTGDKVSNGELVHSDKTRRSWSFKWTAPTTPGTYNFYAVGMTSNGSSDNNDSWNWYGNAPSTAFPVKVESQTPTVHTSWGQVKARFRK